MMSHKSANFVEILPAASVLKAASSNSIVKAKWLAVFLAKKHQS